MSIEARSDDAPKPNWQTVTKYPLKPRTLWQKFQDAAQLVGVRFGRETLYAVLDIDEGSPYLAQLSIIRAALETVGICRTLPVRSSWSGGLHLYIPLPKAVNTFDLACTLRQCLESQGLEVKDGQLEIFPNTKAFGAWWKGEFFEYKAHRLPLQPGSGSCLLDDNLQPIGGDLERFFWAWDIAAMSQDMDVLHQALAISRENRRRRPRQRAAGPVESWRADLESEIAEGWTGPGQTNHLLKSIACFGHVFERLAGEELREYTERIATSRPGYERWCQHHHDIRMRCRVWSSAVERYYYPLGTQPKSHFGDRHYKSLMETIRQQLADDARQRIAAAYADLKGEGLPEQIRRIAQQLTQRACCSMQTLYKYLDLWHPAHVASNTPVTPAQSAISPPDHPPSATPPPMATPLVKSAVTAQGGNNEGCSAETPPLKFLSPEGERMGCGEGEGFSTGRFSTGEAPA